MGPGLSGSTRILMMPCLLLLWKTTCWRFHSWPYHVTGPILASFSAYTKQNTFICSTALNAHFTRLSTSSHHFPMTFITLSPLAYACSTFSYITLTPYKPSNFSTEYLIWLEKWLKLYTDSCLASTYCSSMISRSREIFSRYAKSYLLFCSLRVCPHRHRLVSYSCE